MSDRPARQQRRTWSRHHKILVASATVALAAGAIVAIAPTAQAAVPFPVASLDGLGNNVANPNWGRAGLPYSRVAPVRYADGIGTQVPGPNSRYISNRIHNDTNQNLFSERRVSQWGFAWGQFLDHTFGLRRAPG